MYRTSFTHFGCMARRQGGTLPLEAEAGDGVRPARDTGAAARRPGRRVGPLAKAARPGFAAAARRPPRSFGGGWTAAPPQPPPTAPADAADVADAAAAGAAGAAALPPPDAAAVAAAQAAAVVARMLDRWRSCQNCGRRRRRRPSLRGACWGACWDGGASGWGGPRRRRGTPCRRSRRGAGPAWSRPRWRGRR
jgi:hypothetical protein